MPLLSSPLLALYSSRNLYLLDFNYLNYWILLGCMRDRFSSIACPPGYAKLPAAEFDQSCSHKNLTCPQGSDCMCSPCKAVLPPPSIPYKSYTLIASDETDPTFAPLGQQIQAFENFTTACQRMEVCATVNVGSSTYLMVGIHLKAALKWLK